MVDAGQDRKDALRDLFELRILDEQELKGELALVKEPEPESSVARGSVDPAPAVARPVLGDVLR